MTFTRNEILVLRGIQPAFATRLAVAFLGMNATELEDAGFEFIAPILDDVAEFGIEDERRYAADRASRFDRTASLERLAWR